MSLRLILAELLTPSGQAGPAAAVYRRAAEGVWHAVLGAACVAVLGGWGIAAALPLAAAYWWAKERRDLRRGGAFWDGAEDTVMVSLGAWYGAWWWPGLICLCALSIMAIAIWRGGRNGRG